MGGEKFRGLPPKDALKGSPPRGRGKDALHFLRRLSTGITPAWAGKSSGQESPTQCRRDHPRVGGEKFLHVIWLCLREWITPAWAGKSWNGAAAGGIGGDHPRVGGEKIVRFPVLSPVKGSPPRGRGKALWKSSNSSRRRITPAWAGKSFFWGARFRAGGDHPRVGGEKCLPRHLLRSVRGSPPRGRGKGGLLICWTLTRRITPAWAGKRHHQ